MGELERALKQADPKDEQSLTRLRKLLDRHVPGDPWEGVKFGGSSSFNFQTGIFSVECRSEDPPSLFLLGKRVCRVLDRERRRTSWHIFGGEVEEKGEVENYEISGIGFKPPYRGHFSVRLISFRGPEGP